MEKQGYRKLQIIVKLWMEDENSHNQIESMLKENDDNNNEKCNEENLEDQNLVDIEAEQAKYKVKIEELEKELQGVRERVKQQKRALPQKRLLRSIAKTLMEHLRMLM